MAQKTWRKRQDEEPCSLADLNGIPVVVQKALTASRQHIAE